MDNKDTGFMMIPPTSPLTCDLIVNYTTCCFTQQNHEKLNSKKKGEPAHSQALADIGRPENHEVTLEKGEVGAWRNYVEISASSHDDFFISFHFFNFLSSFPRFLPLSLVSLREMAPLPDSMLILLIPG